MASGSDLYRRIQPNRISCLARKPSVVPDPGRASPPLQRAEKIDDFRLSCYVRTVDRVTFPEARDSSNFPGFEYNINFFGCKQNRPGFFLTYFVCILKWAGPFSRLIPPPAGSRDARRIHDTLPTRSSLFPRYASKLTLAEKNLVEEKDEDVLALAAALSIVTVHPA